MRRKQSRALSHLQAQVKINTTVSLVTRWCVQFAYNSNFKIFATNRIIPIFKIKLFLIKNKNSIEVELFNENLVTKDIDVEILIKVENC